MASLRRLGDGEGYSGSSVQAIKYDPEGKKNPEVVGYEPMVGCCLKVGTVSAGMFTTRDWWMTTPIVEILEKTEDMVKFKTRSGSIYEFKR